MTQQNIPAPKPWINFWIVLALMLAFMLTVQVAFCQSIVVAGNVQNADTLNITVWSNGEHVLSQQTTDKVFALILGEKPHYTIAFECFGTTKYAILITDKMKEETIRLSVNFNVKSNVLITKEKSGFLSSDPITYRYYGHHGYRKSF